MGPATSKLCCLPHDFLCCRQCLAVPCLPWDAFCLLPSVCPSVRQPRAAVGLRAAPRGTAPGRCASSTGDTPGDHGWKTGIYQPPGARVQAVNIPHPTSLLAGRRMPYLARLEDEWQLTSDKLGGRPALSPSWGWVEMQQSHSSGFKDSFEEIQRCRGQSGSSLVVAH